MNITIRTAAREDILRQFAYYLDEKGAPRTARRFLDAAESAIEKLRSMPDMGAPREFQNPNLKGLRSWHVPGFPDMRIYYLHREHEVRVLRVLHGKRDIQSILEEGSEDER